ncbi:hydrolase [Streptococcus pneumoniae]|nr:hydrolase [Streptococcus pneumoniae]VSJ49631.1 hydrolase [Streptococcus pneumoniae]VSW32473.1 hydrolase [Streptococcus pneumoniae]
MMIKVIATDMDGTLLDARGQLDLPRLEKILDRWIKGAFVLSLRRAMKFTA